MMTARCLAAAALLLSQPVVQADFLAGLKGKTSQGIAKVFAQQVAKTVPTNVAGKISDLGDSVSNSDLVSNITGGAVKGGIKGAAASSQALAQQVVHDSVREAANSGIASQVAGLVETAPEALDALQRGTPEQAAALLRQTTPQVASAVNRTSLQFSDVLRAQSPRLVAALSNAANRVADQLDAGRSFLPSKGILPDSPEVRRASGCGLAVVGVLMLAFAAGVAVFHRRHKNAGRSMSSGPALLSDVLEGVASSTSPKRQAREPAIQAESQVSLFQKF